MSESNSSAGGSTLQPGQRIKPNVSVEKARELIEEHYELHVDSIRELNSYDDNNFYVKGTTKEGQQKKFTFKVLNSMDSKKAGHIQAEHVVMQLLSENGVNCSVPIQNVKGETFALVTIQNDPKDSTSTESKHIIRLLSFVEGKIMHEVPPTLKLIQKAGTYIAQIEDIIKDLKLPALESHTSVWMVSHVLELEKFLYVIKDDTDHYNLVSEVLTAYRNQALPIVPHLKKGILHGDFNEQNIIVTESLSEVGEYDVHGIIDFGDLQLGPYVFELAVTICYMMLECVKEGVNLDPFTGAQQVLKGYFSVRKLADEELEILRILVACRLCQSLVLGAYTYSLDPGNEYLLTTAKTGWKLLERVWREKTDEEALQCWKEAINQ